MTLALVQIVFFKIILGMWVIRRKNIPNTIKQVINMCWSTVKFTHFSTWNQRSTCKKFQGAFLMSGKGISAEIFGRSKKGAELTKKNLGKFKIIFQSHGGGSTTKIWEGGGGIRKHPLPFHDLLHSIHIFFHQTFTLYFQRLRVHAILYLKFIHS